jgi:hypothetical protein
VDNVAITEAIFGAESDPGVSNKSALAEAYRP